MERSDIRLFFVSLFVLSCFIFVSFCRTTDDVNLSVLRCYLLIRHYCAAIMWSAGIKPAEPHCTLKTIQIMREIIESPVYNSDGSGSMLVIRIPSVELANLAFESLKNTRDRLVLSRPFCLFLFGLMSRRDCGVLFSFFLSSMSTLMFR